MQLTATESQPAVLPLTQDEASLLSSLGRAMASTQRWWCETAGTAERSVVSVERVGDSQHRVTFRDVIGVVSLGVRQISVEPKIPLNHFLYLVGHSELAPRASASPVRVGSGIGFVELLARWFVDAAEHLLRGGLRKDYESFVDECLEVRGALRARETAMIALQGRTVAVCEYEELTQDAPLNRIIRAACERLVGSGTVPKEVRDRARRVAFRMDDVGRLRAADLRVTIDRFSAGYSRAVSLALLVISGCGIASALGTKIGSTFLVRTPELIEDGLRNILADSLPELAITKRRLMLGDTGLSASPDLVFGNNRAIGDVKYSYLAQDWNRSNLNQVVAFATAYRSTLCGVFAFARSRGSPVPRTVPFGPVSASAFAWLTGPDMEPLASAELLCANVLVWLRD